MQVMIDIIGYLPIIFQAMDKTHITLLNPYTNHVKEVMPVILQMRELKAPRD
jgi:hypothetical protein